MSTSNKMQVRVVSRWFKKIDTPEAFFSSDIEPQHADALVCEWEPSDELFTFPRRKAWYSIEPPCQFDKMDNGAWLDIRQKLPAHEFIWYNHPDPRFRIPESTHHVELEIDRRQDRQHRAIAIVSNYGGSPRRRHEGIAYRNRFAISPLVDLFGREVWMSYKHRLFSRARPPKNYQGSIPGDWNTDEKRNLMATYKVAICLENMFEPRCFSEKFVEAVRAGCIPVYRAHPTNLEVLKGAAWIDPQDHDDDPKATIQAALESDREEISAKNEYWMNTNQEFKDTHMHRVYSKIARALSFES